jgi:phosphate transport system substrate-binding protein
VIRRVEQGRPVTLLVDATGAPVARFSLADMAPAAAAEAVRSARADLAIAVAPVPGLTARVLAQDALVAVVSPDNPLVALGTRDLARALSGDIPDWSAVGGPDRPMVVHAPQPGNGLRAAIEARLDRPLAAGVEHATLASLAAAVARDPYALAVLPAHATGPARPLPLTDSCGFALPATTAAVQAGDYPLALPLMVLTPARRLPLILRDFLDFLGTPAAARVVADAGLVGRDPMRTDLIGDGRRLANAIRAAGTEVPVTELQRLTAAMTGAERLTLTFRFDDGGQVLDAASRDALADLIRRIDAGLFDGEEIVLAGFTDGSGDAGANLELSRQRAETLRQAIDEGLAQSDVPRTTLTVEAFGEALPIACDESLAGRRINRRVEVWLRPLPAAPGR